MFHASIGESYAGSELSCSCWEDPLVNDPFANVKVTRREIVNIQPESNSDWCICTIIFAIVQCALAMFCLASFPWSEDASEEQLAAEDKTYPIRNPFPNPKDTSGTEYTLKQIISGELSLHINDYKVSDGSRAFIQRLRSVTDQKQLSLRDISKITVTSTKVKQGSVKKATTLVLDAFAFSKGSSESSIPLFSHVIYG